MSVITQARQQEIADVLAPVPINRRSLFFGDLQWRIDKQYMPVFAKVASAAALGLGAMVLGSAGAAAGVAGVLEPIQVKSSATYRSVQG